MTTQNYEDRTATADYISRVAAELAQMAASAEHNVLAHLLQMARLESEQICGRGSGPVEQDDNDVAFAQTSDAKFGSSNVVPLVRARARE
jgi:hypothetical protein